MVPWSKAPATMTYLQDFKSTNSEMGVIKQGYIFKQSHSVLKHWRTRYLVLTIDCIRIYKRKGDLGSLPSEVISFDGLSVIFEDGNDKRRKFCLKISSGSSPVTRRAYLICFFSEEDRAEWCSQILETVTSRWVLEKEIKETPFRLASRLVDVQSRPWETLSHGAVKLRAPANFRGRERPRSMEISALNSTLTPKQGRPLSKNFLAVKFSTRPLSLSTEFLCANQDIVFLPLRTDS